jgi:hypothetical protein
MLAYALVLKGSVMTFDKMWRKWERVYSRNNAFILTRWEEFITTFLSVVFIREITATVQFIVLFNTETKYGET